MSEQPPPQDPYRPQGPPPWPGPPAPTGAPPPAPTGAPPPVQGPYGQQPYGQQPPGPAPYWPGQAPPSAQGPYAQAPYPPVPPRPTDISQYAAPKPKRAALLGALVGVALVGVALVAALTGGLRPGPTPRTPGPAVASTTQTTPGQPFSMPSDSRSTGTWEIVEREWTSGGVSVHVKIYATAGTISYAFNAFAAGSVESTTPKPGPKRPELRSGVLEAGESVDGWIFLPVPRGDVTLFLTTATGRAYSAQPVRA